MKDHRVLQTQFSAMIYGLVFVVNKENNLYNFKLILTCINQINVKFEP